MLVLGTFNCLVPDINKNTHANTAGPVSVKHGQPNALDSSGFLW